MKSPKSIQTATAQISEIIANVASSQYRGCSADRIDAVLSIAEKVPKAPQGCEEWVLPEAGGMRRKLKKTSAMPCNLLSVEISTLFTSNGQTPFTSLGFGLGTSRFELEIQRNYLDHSYIKGLGSEHRTAIFPKLISTLKEALTWKKGTQTMTSNSWPSSGATKRITDNACPMIRLLNWQIQGSTMGLSLSLQGWKDENNEVEFRSDESQVLWRSICTSYRPRVWKGIWIRFEIFNERMNIAEDALVYHVLNVPRKQHQRMPPIAPWTGLLACVLEKRRKCW